MEILEIQDHGLHHSLLRLHLTHFTLSIISFVLVPLTHRTRVLEEAQRVYNSNAYCRSFNAYASRSEASLIWIPSIRTKVSGPHQIPIFTLKVYKPLYTQYIPSRDLHPYTASNVNRDPVIDAYSQSLRLVFISAIAMFVIVNALVFTIKLPHLKKKERVDDDGESDS